MTTAMTMASMSSPLVITSPYTNPTTCTLLYTSPKPTTNRYLANYMYCSPRIYCNKPPLPHHPPLALPLSDDKTHQHHATQHPKPLPLAPSKPNPNPHHATIKMMHTHLNATAMTLQNMVTDYHHNNATKPPNMRTGPCYYHA